MSAAVNLLPLRRPELSPVWNRIREHLERHGWAKLGSVSVDLDAQQAATLAGLLGTSRLRPGRLRLDLARLDQALRSSRLNTGLLDALEQIGGKLVDGREIRITTAASEAELWSRLYAHSALALHAGLREWLTRMRQRGTARRIAGERVGSVLEQVLMVVGQLPARDLPLQRLAVRVGSAHDLDWDQPLGSLILNALAHLHGQAPPTSALGRRQLWAEFGVILDALSPTVLALNLQPEGEGLLAGILRACAQAGEPASVTLGQLNLEKLTFPSGHAAVLICENPVVMEVIKTKLGASAPPIVCVAGRFNTAAGLLLGYLVNAGVRLRYHGDFDYPGIAIANEVIARFGAEPWLFDIASYRRALETSPGHPPEGRLVVASWDSELAPAIAFHRRAVHQEAVVEDLLSELVMSKSLSAR